MREVQGTLTAWIDELASHVFNLIYPARCPICERPPDRYSISPLCDRCWDGIRRYEGPACGICAKPLKSEYAARCGECLKKRPPYSRAVSYGLYSGALREAIHLFKFGPVKRLARPLGGLLAALDLPPDSLVVPVPLGLGGLRERGFNQTLLLARVVAGRRGMRLETGLLYKKKETPPQVSLSRAARMKNLRGAFGMRGGLAGEKVLLVDDVITTGATVGECARALLRAGAGEVCVASLARAGEGLADAQGPFEGWEAAGGAGK